MTVSTQALLLLLGFLAFGLIACQPEETCSGQSEVYLQNAYELIDDVEYAFLASTTGDPKEIGRLLEEAHEEALILEAPDCALESKEIVVEFVRKTADLIRLLDEGRAEEAKGVAEEVVRLRREAQLSILDLKLGSGDSE